MMEEEIKKEGVIIGEGGIPIPAVSPVTMADRIKDVQEKIDLLFMKKGGKDAKGFKLPSSVKRGWKQKLKKNYCLTILIKNNLNMEFKLLEVIDGAVYLPLNDTWHMASVDYMMVYDGKPVLILPEWNLIPFNPKKNYEQAEENSTLAAHAKFVITKVKQAQAGVLKKKTNMKTVVIVGVIILVGVYLLSTMLGKGGP
jgi:hypothetical protein